MKKNIILFLILTIFFNNCSNNSIDKTIQKINNSDLSNINGLTIYFRSAGQTRNSNIYFVNSFGVNCSPYIVEVNMSNLEIIKIKNNLVLESCHEDYLDMTTIEKAIADYLALKVCLIKVDSVGNVYINPTQQEQPTMLRKSKGYSPKDIEQFEYYKGDWYIRK